jgi:hypothetical protein
VGNESQSFAADEHAGHTAFAMRCHDDSIAAFMLSHVEYGLAGIAMAAMHSLDGDVCPARMRLDLIEKTHSLGVALLFVISLGEDNIRDDYGQFASEVCCPGNGYDHHRHSGLENLRQRYSLPGSL